MLCRRNGKLFESSAMLGSKFFGRKCRHLSVIHLIAETPIILRPHEACSSPLVVAPPHVAQREEGFHLFGIVGIVAIAIVGILIMWICRIGDSLSIVIGVFVLNTATIGIYVGRSVIEQQRFSVPHKPKIFIFSGFVNTLVEALHNGDYISVERPEAELRYFIALAFHSLHGAEEHLPFVPIQHGIGNIKHEYIYTRV